MMQANGANGTNGTHGAGASPRKRVDRRPRSVLVPVQPLRLKLRDAAAVLGMSKETMENMVVADVFTVDRDCEGGNVYLLYDELQEWARHAGRTRPQKEAALRAFRRERGRPFTTRTKYM